MFGIKVTQKEIKELAEQLKAQNIGFELTPQEWLEYREVKAKNHTRIAYSMCKYGVSYELFYDKNNNKFILI